MKEEEDRKKKAAKEAQIANMKGPQQPSHKRETEAERKMRERQEELKAEEERKAKEKLQGEINVKVAKACSTYRKALYQIKDVIQRKGADIRAVFRIYDTNKDFQVDFEELKKILNDQGIRFRDSDLRRVFKLIDQEGKGKVAHVVFADTLKNPESLNIEKYVRSLLDVQGNWINEESKNDATEEAEPIKSNLTTVGEGLKSEGKRHDDIGSVDGLSAIMKKSAGTDQESRALISDDDTLSIYNGIKEILLKKYFSFDSLLQTMDKPKGVD